MHQGLSQQERKEKNCHQSLVWVSEWGRGCEWGKRWGKLRLVGDEMRWLRCDDCNRRIKRWHNICSLFFFSQYFHTNWSNLPFESPPLLQPCCSCLCTLAHPNSVHIHNAKVNDSLPSLISFTSKLWDRLTRPVFPASYDKNFQMRSIETPLQPNSTMSFGFYCSLILGTAQHYRRPFAIHFFYIEQHFLL